MSFQLIYTYTKTDPLVEWFSYGDDVQAVIDKHKANGNITEYVVEDIDGLTRQYRITFSSIEASQQLGAESTISSLEVSRENYNRTNNITGVKSYGQ